MVNSFLLVVAVLAATSGIPTKPADPPSKELLEFLAEFPEPMIEMEIPTDEVQDNAAKDKSIPADPSASRKVKGRDVRRERMENE